jgi:hypothetical protein
MQFSAKLGVRDYGLSEPVFFKSSLVVNIERTVHTYPNIYPDFISLSRNTTMAHSYSTL